MATDTITSAGAGTWQVPAGVREIFVEVWGGGAGSVDSGGTGDSPGGGGGAYSASTIAVVPGQIFDVYVADQGPTSAPCDGDESWFDTDTTVRAEGGFGYVSGEDRTSVQPGGRASQGFGDTKFSGGSGGGADTTSGGGGGGGGAAGAPGNGSNGTSASGGTGGTGGAGSGDGGDGGEGADEPLDNNTAGAAPGGGAGGSADIFEGRTGGRGEIRITYSIGPGGPGLVAVV